MPTFTPTNTVDMSKEKDWAYNLGTMDWDNTNIVFTKRSLVEFLKYTGVTVDSGFANIKKLPNYAKFGKITNTAAGDTTDSQDDAEPSITPSASGESFKPSRRVRQAPGGGHTDIFAHDDGDDALSMAPKRPEQPEQPSRTHEPAASEEEQGINFTSEVKPSRRVRTAPGGHDSIGNLWGAEDGQDEFKPTRRVREGPGGQDSLWNMEETETFKPTRRVRQGPGGKDSVSGIF